MPLMNSESVLRAEHFNKHNKVMMLTSVAHCRDPVNPLWNKSQRTAQRVKRQ